MLSLKYVPLFEPDHAEGATTNIFQGKHTKCIRHIEHRTVAFDIVRRHRLSYEIFTLSYIRCCPSTYKYRKGLCTYMLWHFGPCLPEIQNEISPILEARFH